MIYLLICLLQAKSSFSDINKFKEFVDPSLECKYPVRELGKVVGIVAKCVEEEPHNRPNIVKSLKEITSSKSDQAKSSTTS
jgi:CRISPR/Cas system CSM-associated protein Csm4 (group 5 of RAMP superfamily)